MLDPLDEFLRDWEADQMLDAEDRRKPGERLENTARHYLERDEKRREGGGS